MCLGSHQRGLVHCLCTDELALFSALHSFKLSIVGSFWVFFPIIFPQTDVRLKRGRVAEQRGSLRSYTLEINQNKKGGSNV